MRLFLLTIILTPCFLLVLTSVAAASPSFKKVMIVVFENEDSANVMAQPAFKKFAESGANLTNFIAETHPCGPRNKTRNKDHSLQLQ